MTKRDTYLNQLTAALRRRTPGTGSGSGITALTGDGTATGPGSAALTISSDAVTNAKLANMAEATVKLRADGTGTGDPIDGTPDQLSAILDLATDPFLRSSLAGGSPGPGGGVIGTVPTSGWTVRNGILWNDYLTPLSLGFWVIDNASLNWRLLTQSLNGASEYTVIATILGDIAGGGANSTTFGLYLYDGTKAIGFEMLSQSGGSGGKYRLRVQRLTNLNTDGGTQAGPTISIAGYPVTLKIVQDASNRTFYYYQNATFTQFYQESAGTYLTETDVGVGGISATGTPSAGVGGELLQWSLF